MAYMPTYPVCPRCLKVCEPDELIEERCQSCWRDVAEDGKAEAQQLNAERLAVGEWWE